MKERADSQSALRFSSRVVPDSESSRPATSNIRVGGYPSSEHHAVIERDAPYFQDLCPFSSADPDPPYMNW